MLEIKRERFFNAVHSLTAALTMVHEIFMARDRFSDCSGSDGTGSDGSGSGGDGFGSDMAPFKS